MKQTHILKSGGITWKMDVTEKPDRVLVSLTVENPSGKHVDSLTAKGHILPILKKYDNDPRPLVLDNPALPFDIITYGDSNGSKTFYVLKDEFNPNKKP